LLVIVFVLFISQILISSTRKKTAQYADKLTDSTLDWIMQNSNARPILANILKNLLYTDEYSVSDHCPVMCIYEFESGLYFIFNKNKNIISL